MKRRRPPGRLATELPGPSTRWCPRGHGEYRPGFTTCAECEAELVEEKPREDETGSPRRALAASRPVFSPFCPRCGARFLLDMRGEWFETSQRCSQCGVAVLEHLPPLAPTSAEVGYRLAELTLVERTAVTAELIERRLPFRWEEDLVLFVPEAAEEVVDRLVDEVAGEVADDAADDVADDVADAVADAVAAAVADPVAADDAADPVVAAAVVDDEGDLA